MGNEEKKTNLSYVEWLEQVVAEYQPDWICDELVAEDSWCYDRCESKWDKECLMRYYNKHFSEVKWIRHFDDLFPEESTIECPICREHQPIGIDKNYCPNCGAKMKGAE